MVERGWPREEGLFKTADIYIRAYVAERKELSTRKPTGLSSSISSAGIQQSASNQSATPLAAVSPSGAAPGPSGATWNGKGLEVITMADVIESGGQPCAIYNREP
jgi:hypothetical protein